MNKEALIKYRTENVVTGSGTNLFCAISIYDKTPQPKTVYPGLVYSKGWTSLQTINTAILIAEGDKKDALLNINHKIETIRIVAQMKLNGFNFKIEITE